MTVCPRVNVDLVLVDNELMIPFECIKGLFTNAAINKPSVVDYQPQTQTEQLTPELNIKPAQEVSKKDYTLTRLKNIVSPADKLSYSTICKIKQLDSSEQIQIANSLLENLFEDNSKLIWYKTNSYYGIAEEQPNSLICYYTPEPQKSKFLSVYIKINKVKDYLIMSSNRRWELHLPELGVYKVNRLTTNELCVVHTYNSKTFYLLIKKLVRMFSEN